MIRNLLASDIDSIVYIHKNCFSRNVSTQWGNHFLSGYYSGYCQSQNGIALVYEENETIIGFIVGGINITSLSREIASHSKIHFIKSIFVNLFKHPLMTIQKFTQYTRDFLLPKKVTFHSNKTAGLNSIAVLPEYREKGIATKLLTAFLNELKNRELFACRLGVEADNMSAKILYENNGFECVNDDCTSYIYFFDEDFKRQYNSKK